METTEFKYYQFPFYKFNQVQEACLPLVPLSCNIILSSATASGKTVIGIAAMSYELQKNEKSKVVYISPYKGISNEKLGEWEKDEQLSKYGLIINTGDRQAKKEDFINNRIIIITSESLESKFRNKNEWLKDVSLFVFDEGHLLGQDGRGSCIESLIMMISKMDARIIMLSGTMENSIDIAKWIKEISKKETKHIKSNWRPNKLVRKIHLYEAYKDKIENKLKELDKVLETRKFSEKVLIFVHSIEMGKMVQKHLGRKYYVGFHNALLNERKRKDLEELFRDEFSDLNILISTSTLAAGVNL